MRRSADVGEWLVALDRSDDGLAALAADYAVETTHLDAPHGGPFEVFLSARPHEEAQPELVDVGDLVDQVLRIVRREIEQTAVLERDIDRDLPPLLVPRTRLAQVLTNVLINAAHAVREVERSVHRVRISARADDEAVAIVVSDTGPGIAPDDVDRIFDPFYTTKRQDLGTGLGLSISYGIVAGMNGVLLAENGEDGAIFRIELPRIMPTAGPGAPAPANEIE